MVRLIFAEYLEGNGDRAIAKGLNQDGVPCPSARRPDQNMHLLADGWQGSTVRSIVENPRYTGYAFFARVGEARDAAEPGRRECGACRSVPPGRARGDRAVSAAGASGDRVCGGVHSGAADAAVACRGRDARDCQAGSGADCWQIHYLLKGLVRCEVCQRKMQGAVIRTGIYYRCIARTLAPGSLCSLIIRRR